MHHPSTLPSARLLSGQSPASQWEQEEGDHDDAD